MRQHRLLAVVVLLPACASAKGTASAPPGAPTSVEATPIDAGPVPPSAAAPDVGLPADASCASDWLAMPSVPSALALPAAAGAVLRLRVTGIGTQDYQCRPLGDGGSGWSFVGPEAELDDCHGRIIGKHFAADAGVNPPPEWMMTGDGSYAIGGKLATFTPDAGPKAIPWLLLRVVGESDAGVLGKATFVQRLRTDGGLQPAGACAADAGIVRVPYTADYYFYGR